jgi:hypothetical protein
MIGALTDPEDRKFKEDAVTFAHFPLVDGLLALVDGTVLTGACGDWSSK